MLTTTTTFVIDMTDAARLLTLAAPDRPQGVEIKFSRLTTAAGRSATPGLRALVTVENDGRVDELAGWLRNKLAAHHGDLLIDGILVDIAVLSVSNVAYAKKWSRPRCNCIGGLPFPCWPGAAPWSSL